VPRGALELARSIATPAEPYGVALAPDAGTLLVTAIADRVVVAYDLPGAERWRWTSAPERARSRSRPTASTRRHAPRDRLRSR